MTREPGDLPPATRRPAADRGVSAERIDFRVGGAGSLERDRARGSLLHSAARDDDRARPWRTASRNAPREAADERTDAAMQSTSDTHGKDYGWHHPRRAAREARS